MSAPTTAQLQIAIAALARSFTLPAVNANQTGITRGDANQLKIPIASNNAQGLYNQQLGANLNISVNAAGTYLMIARNVGDAS